MEGFKPVRLAYNTHVPATGADETLAPIIYLHGLSALKEYWLDIPQKVADATKRKSYSVDARNHGESEASDHFNFDLNVDDLFHFLDTQGIQKAILVGHSMGGMTSVKAALRRPDRVEAIIVEDMYVKKVPKSVGTNIATFLGLVNKVLRKFPAEFSDEKTLDLAYQKMLEKAPPELAERITRSREFTKSVHGKRFFKRTDDGHLTMKCNVDAILKGLADYENLTSEPEGVFDGPALFIYGTLSAFKVGDEEEHIKQFFPKAVLKGIEEDHSIHIPKPVEFTDAVLDFL